MLRKNEACLSSPDFDRETAAKVLALLRMVHCLSGSEYRALRRVHVQAELSARTNLRVHARLVPVWLRYRCAGSVSGALSGLAVVSDLPVCQRQASGDHAEAR